MSTRKTADAREKQLRLAIHRIEHDRAHTKATRLNVSTVAHEAGVTPALIHNHYPAIAELIRIKRGASSRAQRDAKQTELAEERKKNTELRRQLEEMTAQLAALATVNEMLLVENRSLKASLQTKNVVQMDSKKR